MGVCTACTSHAHGMRTACARQAHFMRTARARHGGARALEQRLSMVVMCFCIRVKLCVLAARASSLSCASVLCTSSSVSSSLRRALCSSSDCTATLNCR
eukprot:scaffold69201_cov63-Phaeocystis_antarctica.AAC.2